MFIGSILYSCACSHFHKYVICVARRPVFMGYYGSYISGTFLADRQSH